jgi:hypothetical protein
MDEMYGYEKGYYGIESHPPEFLLPESSFRSQLPADDQALSA